MEIQTTVEEFPEKIRRLKISPKAAIRVIIDVQAAEDCEKGGKGTEKSKWAIAAERIAETPLSEEAAEHLRKTSREFRMNFRFKDLSDFGASEDDC